MNPPKPARDVFKTCPICRKANFTEAADELVCLTLNCDWSSIESSVWSGVLDPYLALPFPDDHVVGEDPKKFKQPKVSRKQKPLDLVG